MCLCAALDLGVFDVLHKNPDFTAYYEDLARTLQVSPRGLWRLLDALVSFGLLSRDEDYNYTLTEIAITHLVPDKFLCYMFQPVF
jgi:DNA-binding IclR family transcriptional regulator